MRQGNGWQPRSGHVSPQEPQFPGVMGILGPAGVDWADPRPRLGLYGSHADIAENKGPFLHYG